MDISTITSLLGLFGFVIILGLALIAESFVKKLVSRGWTLHKIKFTFFDLIDRCELKLRNAKLFRSR